MKTHYRIAGIALACILFLMGSSCFAQQPATATPSGEQAQFPKSDEYVNTKLTYTIIPTENSTWGYEIFAEGRLMISQKSIPALPGNNGFKEQDQAMKVAELVIQKIRKGEMPPTVTVEELNALGIK